MSRRNAGQAGLIIILLVLLAVASLAILNFRSTEDSKTVEGESPASSPPHIDHFKNEMKKIEEIQLEREKVPANDNQ